MLAGLSAGAATGAVLGLVGSTVGTETRATLATALALVAIVVGVAETTGRRIPLLQLDRETPYAWVETGPWRWALRNGAAIGFGAGTRLGFWLWYVVPLGAFISGRPLLGAIGYGSYALVRTISAGGMLLLLRRGQIDKEGRWVLDLLDTARGIASTQLIAVGLSTVLLAGI